MNARTMTCILPIVCWYSLTSASSVLDPESHPDSTDRTSFVPSDTTDSIQSLPWKTRFDSEGGFTSHTGEGDEHPAEPMGVGSDADRIASATGDAAGVVLAIRSSQGKVKLEHGPIEKLGMPGMTMLFKVKDPAMLEALKKGDEIRFNVEDTASGYVITEILK